LRRVEARAAGSARVAQGGARGGVDGQAKHEHPLGTLHVRPRRVWRAAERCARRWSLAVVGTHGGLATKGSSVGLGSGSGWVGVGTHGDLARKGSSVGSRKEMAMMAKATAQRVRHKPYT
jgi:hypothetical protein